MVDFNLLGTLTLQRDLIAALFRARLYKRILVVVANDHDVTRTRQELLQAIHNNPASQLRLRVQPTRIASSDDVCSIRLVTGYNLYNVVGLPETDLVWFRYLDGREPEVSIVTILMANRKGYNPLILWGDVPTEVKKRYE
jgi:hypothetical protein